MASILKVLGVLSAAVYSTYGGGGCSFPASWTGSWFQSGYPGLIPINSTHIHSKGECSDTDSDKFLLYDRSDDCYRCMVIHEKHNYVLQYKETYCSSKDTLAAICESISGDAPLYSMFRKEPRPVPEQCPFHSAPFTFTYNRGSGDCANPPSRAEQCTDDSRLLLRYMACPDVPATESNVEELVCLATWKEGSTRYLVGQIWQVNRRNSIVSDEDTYRCFIYKGQHSDRTVTYNIAMSGDATCNGLSSPTDGSRTMKLTNSDDEHNRCHYPAWATEHHKWFSLDHQTQYHFTTKNATLKIINVEDSSEEKRLVCHSILEHRDKKHIKLVAHLTQGCESGHVCLTIFRRENNVLELQQGAALWESPHDACAAADSPRAHTATLVAASLKPTRCPLAGRYWVMNSRSLGDRRRRRQLTIGEEGGGAAGATGAVGGGEAGGDADAAECVSGHYDSAELGCGPAHHTIEFKSHCLSTVYTCYGSWEVGRSRYVVAAPAGAARASTLPRMLCFIYTHHHYNESSAAGAAGGGWISVTAVAGACSGPAGAADTAYNLTSNGTCEQSSKFSYSVRLSPAALLVALLTFASLVVR